MTTIPPGLHELLSVMWQRTGTDLFLTAGLAASLRVDGDVVAMDGEAPLSDDDLLGLVTPLLSQRQLAAFNQGEDVDFSFAFQDVARIRGNLFRQKNHPAAVLRMIPRKVPTLDALSSPDQVRRFAQLGQGMVLVTGPTGSGKSTTLAAMVDWINHNRACHILTIEDPIEYEHDHSRAIVNQRGVGEDTDSFQAALRSALRENPDVILVGEMRDRETIELALTLAETGHLVFATLHTNDAAQAIDRVIDVFPGGQQGQVRVQLAASLSGVVYQRLLPKAGGGIVAAYEILVANSAVRALIRANKTNQIRNQMITGQRDGMQTLEMHLSQLVRAGTITREEATTRSHYPGEID